MILGIESSCDESALSLFDPVKGVTHNWVHTQIDLHQMYGGVVPDLASRKHMKNFLPLLDLLLEATNENPVSKIAVTAGPGLAGCLAMGISLAKSLGLAWNVPVFGVNHLRGHAFSPFIDLHAKNPENFFQKLKEQLPHLGLIVSGGNTLLFELDESLSLTLLAQTLDDAAGEALDKGAKLLGMPYPGGPVIEKTAMSGDPKKYDFPRAIANKNILKFSFSGLKTSLRYRLEKMSDSELEKSLPDLCASYQEAVVGQLVKKTEHALMQKPYRSLGLSGGVANNGLLRMRFQKLADTHKRELFITRKEYTGDNAAMIAFGAYADPGHLTNENALSFEPGMRLV